jgi:hypothetical protein
MGIKSYLADVCVAVGFQWSMAGTNVQFCYDAFYRMFCLLGFAIKSPVHYIVLSMHERAVVYIYCVWLIKTDGLEVFLMCVTKHLL